MKLTSQQRFVRILKPTYAIEYTNSVTSIREFAAKNQHRKAPVLYIYP